MDGMEDRTPRSSRAGESVAAAARIGRAARRLFELPGTSLALRILWATSLAASIALAALRMYPAAAGQVVLGLIGAGFVLFTIARASVGPREKRPATCGALLSPPMRAVYRAGYALMFCGVVVASLASLRGL